MAEEKKPQEERVPKWQELYDDLFFIFLLGAVIFVVSYTLWGVMELSNLPLWPR